MKFNLTSIYFSIMLPLTLGYIESKRETEGKGDLTPLIFLFILMVIVYFKEGHTFAILWFKIRGFFL